MKKILSVLIFLTSLADAQIALCEEISYSHVDDKGVSLDEKLIHLMNYEKGIFIEAGAHDGLFQSNTKRLEEFHQWKGILIEPSISLYEQLCTNRPNSICYSCALGSFEDDASWLEGDFDGNPMASVHGERLNRDHKTIVPVRALQSILDEVGYHHINFFSLDAEGYELKILKGIDFSKTLFDYILVEIYKDKYNQIVKLLNENGYELIENFSNYNHRDNPHWDGLHNDYLFRRKNFNGILAEEK